MHFLHIAFDHDQLHFFENGENIAGGVFEPGYVWAVVLVLAAEDAFLVGFHFAVIVFELNAFGYELVDGGIDVFDFKI